MIDRHLGSPSLEAAAQHHCTATWTSATTQRFRVLSSCGLGWLFNVFFARDIKCNLFGPHSADV
jgi:hypothetical protein